jgi:hypothetical protein
VRGVLSSQAAQAGQHAAAKQNTAWPKSSSAMFLCLSLPCWLCYEKGSGLEFRDRDSEHKPAMPFRGRHKCTRTPFSAMRPVPDRECHIPLEVHELLQFADNMGLVV